jgi:RNA polymerase sigma-70 factor (ECF subfamily)
MGTLAPIPTRSHTTDDDAASTDDALIGRAQAGDRDALERLLRRHYNRIYAVCRRVTAHDADAADAAQNTLIAVARGLPRFDVRSRFSTWVYRIAVNCSIDELRRRSRWPSASVDPSLLETSPGDAAMDRIETSPERMDVDAALRQLPAPFRAAVVLRDMCGLDYAEIAEILDLPPGTVRSRIARGRGALVRLLASSRSAP